MFSNLAIIGIRKHAIHNLIYRPYLDGDDDTKWIRLIAYLIFYVYLTIVTLIYLRIMPHLFGMAPRIYIRLEL